MDRNSLNYLFVTMDKSAEINMTDQPAGPGEPSTSGVTAIYKEQLAYYNNLRDERKRLEVSQASHPGPPGAGNDSTGDSDSFDKDSWAKRKSLEHDLFELRSQLPYRGRRADFDGQDQATLPPPRFRSYPTRMRDRKIQPPKRRPPRYSDDEDYNESQYPRHAPVYRASPFDRRSDPDHYASAEAYQHRTFSHDPLILEDSSSRERKFWDNYNLDPNMSGDRSRESQRGNPALPPAVVIPQDRDKEIHSQPWLVHHGNAYSSHESMAVPPFRNTPSHHNPYYLERDVSLHKPHDLEVDSNGSLSEDDESWVDAGGLDSQDSSRSNALLGQTDASTAVQLHSNMQADEDLLNPSDWNQRLSVTERAIKESHNNRNSWPDTWRHSDNKTCPKALRNVWAQVLDVDHSISQLGLDAAVPWIDNSKYQSKRKGTLAEVVTAYKARPRQETEEVASLPPSSSLMPGPESWKSTCEQVQRLLRVRDYLIAVCRDAEYLNNFHPTMDAITWFEQAQSIGNMGFKSTRSGVIELMSLKISNLAEIIQSLNVVLKALVWGWSDQGTICIESDQEIANKKEQGFFNQLTKERKWESTRSKTIASKSLDNGQKRIQTCIQTLELGLETINDEVEVFGAILSQALFYQCDVLISDDLAHGEVVNYGRQSLPGLVFTPRGLKCMGGLIQNRNVWVLEQFPNARNKYPYVSPPTTKPISLRGPLSYIRAAIVDLARIWGPIWQASELYEGDLWLWYQLPGGYIGASKQGKADVAWETDEIPCHFSTVLDENFGTCPSSEFFVPVVPYLLIGYSLPIALVHRKSCQLSIETGLGGMALQTIGTLKPFKYVDSSSFNIAVGQAGAQASWNTQIKINPGIPMKQSLLDRWKLEPKFRNPRLLLLWYGLEVSCCTRNARRCRLVDLIRSHSFIQYLSTIYRPELRLNDYKTALFEALNHSNPNAFIQLYDNHPEWQGELGTVVARCLEVLKESGVNRKNDLAAFAFIEKFHDPEQLAILPRKDHTWIPLLKDSFDSATFALMSHQCLGYPKAPGQTCRLKDRARQESKSVLETSYTSTKQSNMINLFGRMQVNQKLTMRDSSRFNIKRRSSKGILLGTWRGGHWRYLRIPRPSEELFREKRQDGENAIRVFVVSSRRCMLVRLRESPEVVPLINEDDSVSSRIDSKHVVHNEPSSQPSQTASSPSSSAAPSGSKTKPVPQRKSRTSTMDDASTLRGDETGSPGEASKHKGVSPSEANNGSRNDKATQTDHSVDHPKPINTPSPTKNGEFLLQPPVNGSSSRHRRGSGSDAGSASTGRTYGNSSGNQGESKGNSSHHHHRHRRSHGDDAIEESFPRNENLASKLGFKSSRR